MQVYTRSTSKTNLLSEEHERTLGESAIATPVSAARGYWSARTGKEVPQDHGYLPQKPGMVVPVHTLDGDTFARLRLDAPGKGRKYMQPVKFPSRLDVHPFQHKRIKQPGGIRYITEGEKKVDAGVSAGLLMLGLAGVWNGQKNGELIPDWDYLPLQGEHYAICFDAPDMTENINVQGAADRNARLLQAQGATVSVVWLPPGPDGEKQGLDDFLANGGTVRELEMLTRPYDPADFARVRMNRNEKLRDGYKNLLADWWRYDWEHFVGKPNINRETGEITENPNYQRGHGARKAKLALTSLVPERGKLKGDAIEVYAGLRYLCELARCSKRAMSRALENLQADGQLEIIKPDSREKAYTYRLNLPARRVDSMESKATEEKESKELLRRVSTLRAPSVPRLMSSKPASRRKEFETVEGRGVVRSTGALPPDQQENRDAIKRLGPHRGAIVDLLELVGAVEGETVEGEALMDAANYTGRRRDFYRRRLKDLEEAGVIFYEGSKVGLSRAWRENLDARREQDREIEQAEKQAERHQTERDEYREYLKRKKLGTAKASMDAARRTKEKREQRLQEIAEEKKRDQAATPPAVARFIEEMLRKNKRIRMELLADNARVAGLRPRDIRPAVRRLGYRVERLQEHQNEEFVFAPCEATVTPLEARLGPPPVPETIPEPEPIQEESEPEPADDWRDHSLACECDICDTPITKYAKIRRIA